MFDTKSDYSLNKNDPDAIVCRSMDGVHTRLTREDFASEEEFLRWKKWSDDDYYTTENDKRSYYDAIRLQNELTLALNQGSEKPEYIKTLALAVAAQRYRQLPDPTPAHEMERLRVRLEQGPADAAVLSDLLRTAVRAIRLTPSKNVELELVTGKIITEKETQSA